jgi:NAD(P)H-dependent flavin oxidoreductase YrpB (nitropropane dioxygenase family)
LGDVPFIASGGFADGYGLMAALSLGAAGINMGTRFMCTVEAPIHLNVKQAIVSADEHQTTLILRRWTNTSRMYSNKMTAKAIEIELESSKGEFAEVAPVVSGARGREVLVGGDIQHGVRVSLLTARCPNSSRSNGISFANWEYRSGTPGK